MQSGSTNLRQRRACPPPWRPPSPPTLLAVLLRAVAAFNNQPAATFLGELAGRRRLTGAFNSRTADTGPAGRGPAPRDPRGREGGGRRERGPAAGGSGELLGLRGARVVSVWSSGVVRDPFISDPGSAGTKQKFALPCPHILFYSWAPGYCSRGIRQN